MEKTVAGQLQETMPVTWQHHEDLGACMGELYEKSLWTDVKFHCKENKENVILHAHKIVLAARSPVFQAMFFGPCADGKEDIEFDHAEARVLDLFLRLIDLIEKKCSDICVEQKSKIMKVIDLKLKMYMYTDSTDLDEDTAPSVLNVAHYYQIKKLVQFCANYLATILTTENACKVFSLSMLYQITSLREACCIFIDKNADEILHSKGFLDLPEECLLYIVKGDTFFTGEKGIFTISEEWATQKLRQENLEMNGKNIRKALGKTFYYMRLPIMTYETLMDCIRRKGYFSVDEYEDIVDFINEIPGSSVQSNSCVPRIPAEETLTLNREGRKTITLDKISTSFQISVTRDLKLSYFTLAKVQECLKYNEMYCYKKSFLNLLSFTSKLESSRHDFPLGYTGKAIKVTESGGILELEKVDIKTFLNKFDVAVSGHFEITCHNDKKKQNLKQENGDAKNKNDEDEDPSEHSTADDDTDDADHGDDDDVEAVDDIKLILEQDFELLSSKISERIIDLKEHVILTKASSPYTFNLTLKYSRNSNMKMKTTCCSAADTKTSEHGQLQVKNIKGGFAGIKDLHFENISGRETV